MHEENPQYLKLSYALVIQLQLKNLTISHKILYHRKQNWREDTPQSTSIREGLS